MSFLRSKEDFFIFFFLDLIGCVKQYTNRAASPLTASSPKMILNAVVAMYCREGKWDRTEKPVGFSKAEGLCERGLQWEWLELSSGDRD